MNPRPYADGVAVLERDDELARLRAALADARAGQGSGFALTGESGAGKSTLVEAVCAEAEGLQVLRGHCDPLHTPRPLGPFRDLGVAGLEAIGRADATLAEACELVYETLRLGPTVLVVEDLHWVDAASVDVLRFLARRVESMPLVLLMTYRDLEVDRRHPARPLLGDVAQLDGVESLPLSPLSLDAVTALLDGSGLDAARVHAVTGGNPFFVTEVAKEPDRPMPVSVRDAVLARTADVSSEDFEVLQLVATAPDRLDDRVLPKLGVDLPTLRRLDETSLLARTDGGIVCSGTSSRGWRSRARSRRAEAAGCTRGCSTPSSWSSLASRRSSPTTRSSPGTRPARRRTPARPRRTPSAPVRTARPRRSTRSPSRTSTRRPPGSGPSCWSPSATSST